MALLARPDLISQLSYKIKYEPKGASLALFSDRSEEVCLVGPAGTGKSLSILHKMHLALSKYPLAKAVMARKTRASMTNSCLDMFQRHVLKPPDKVHFHKQDQCFYYPNGSLLAIVGMDDPERILSTDWDMIYIQEVTELTENDYEVCTTRLRSFVMPYQQMLSDCNPSKPTHWVKKRIDKGQLKMLLSYHTDNPRLYDARHKKWTEQGSAYIGKLERLSGVRRSRFYLGQWVAAEGLVYPGWNPDIHLILRKNLPASSSKWPRYWSHDWGHTHPLVWQEWIENPDNGQLIRTREIYRTGMLVEDLARELYGMTSGEYTPRAIICDHDAEDRKILERHTTYLTLPAYKAINTGIQAVTKRLEPDWCAEGPGLLFVRDSTINEDMLLKEMGSPTSTEGEFDGYIWPKKKKEDDPNRRTDEVPVDKDNHGMDATRYIVSFIDSVGDDPEEEESILSLGDEFDREISPY